MTEKGFGDHSVQSSPGESLEEGRFCLVVNETWQRSVHKLCSTKCTEKFLILFICSRKYALLRLKMCSLCWAIGPLPCCMAGCTQFSLCPTSPVPSFSAVGWDRRSARGLGWCHYGSLWGTWRRMWPGEPKGQRTASTNTMRMLSN